MASTTPKTSIKTVPSPSDTKKARLVSTSLDRPTTLVARKTARRPRNTQSKFRAKGRAKPFKFNQKHRRPRRRPFRKNEPNNYEANRQITHTSIRRREAAPLQLLGFSSQQNRYLSLKLVATTATSPEVPLTSLKRTIAHQYLPSTPAGAAFARTQRSYRLRLGALYRPLRRLLTGAQRLRVNRRALLPAGRVSRPVQWTAHKRSALLYTFDARRPSRRTRRKGNPRSGLTDSRTRLARQLIRKFKASRGAKHSAIRRRLVRFRWFNRKFLKKLKYPYRKRVLRRAVRRAARYLQTTIAVLTGAGQRHALRRSCSRTRRRELRSAEIGASLLLSTASETLTQRQQLFSQQQYGQKIRATRLLGAKHRFSQSYYNAKSIRSRSRSYRAALRLQRRLSNRPVFNAGYRSTYRASGLLQRRTSTRTARWLELKGSRVRRSHVLNKKYLATPFLSLQQQSLNTRIRRLASQRQQPRVNGSTNTALMYPESVDARYLERRRRLEFNVRTFTYPSSEAVTSLPPLTALDLDGKAALGRLSDAHGVTTRFQLPSFARNRALRGRASALTSRMNPTLRVANTTICSRAANLTLRAQRTRLLEKRFYRRSNRLRLPRTTVKRREARHSGARVFARNTLKSPETWLGRRKLLLPVTQSYTLSTRFAASATPITYNDLRPVPQLSNAHPRVWTRGPGYHESALVYDIRERKRNAAIRTRGRVVKLRSKKARLPVTAGPSTDSLDAAAAAACAVTSAAQQAAAARLALHRESMFSTTRYNTLRNAGRYSVSTSGLATGRTILRVVKTPTQSKKQKALWHLLSVKKVLASERQLSAWSPHYPTRWRRWSSPRVEGMPSARRWPSRKLMRQRAMINAALAYRGRPKRKHFDHAYGHLQFHHGSAATVGYDRFRRSHRTRSKNNRWWKPVTYPTPFSNPYSRRSINARKNITKRLSRYHVANTGETGTRTRNIRGAWFPVAQPPRLISSRNLVIKRRRFEGAKAFKLREKKERAKIPANLQRWTIRAERYRFGSAAAPRRTRTLTRNARSVRKLEQLYPRSNVWSAGWQKLDPAYAPSSLAALYAEACRKLPTSFWRSLHQQYATRSAALAARNVVFARFSAWYKQLPTSDLITGSSSLLSAAIRCVAAAADAVNTAHLQLEASSYTRKVSQKSDRFWRLRELPRLYRRLKQGTPMLDKRGGSLYKRWLRGAEKYLKHGRAGYLPPKHNRGGSGLIVNFGRNRRRFPASGRRRHSYDATLHAFARRTAPSRFRKVTALRFKLLKAKLTTDSKVNHVAYELSRATRRQRNLARKLGRVAYLSPTWRELLSYRARTPLTLPSEDFMNSAQPYSLQALAPVCPAEYAQPFGSSVKRRFASLPLNLLFRRALTARIASRSKTVLSLRTQRAGLLRTALRRRRQERVFIDLKKHLSRRRLPKEASSVPWRRKKIARRRGQHLRYGDWSPRHFQFKRSGAVFWTLHDLEDRTPRRRDRVRAVLKKSLTGELFNLPRVSIKKQAWFKRGFQIKLPALKAHRRVRRAKKRRRRGRSRITKERRARFHHKSERSNFASLKKFSGRTNKNLLVKVKNRGRKLITTHLRTAGKSKSLYNWRQPKQRILLTKSLRALSSTNKDPSSLGEAPASITLLPFTSRSHKKKPVQLAHRVEATRSKFNKRVFAAVRRVLARNSSRSKAVKASRLEAVKVLRKFTANAITSVGATPLAFQKPTKRVVKSAAEKKRAVLWNIQSKERRYKRTAQYAESLTSYIPKLISHMLSLRIKKDNISYPRAKTWINATYWNLRVYLNVDPFEKRLALRDTNFSLLRSLAHDISVLAKDQVTEHVDRTLLRKRFQSCRIHPAPTSDRFRLDWLRSFFPRKHALFQEDPEEYGTIPVSTRNLRRLIPSGYGIARWRTAPASINLERSARRLLRLRLSKCAPRFETLLQTTQRTPLSEVDSLLPEADPEVAAVHGSARPFNIKLPATAATTSLLLAGLSPGQPSGSFFRRSFTTQAVKAARAVSRYISRRGRLLAPNLDVMSAFVSVASRYRLKGRTEARGRSNFTAHAREALDTGSLDPRFLRYKSPRSRQYLVRLSAKISRPSDQEKLAKFIASRDLYERRDTEANRSYTTKRRLLRIRRRYFYNDRDPQTYAGTLSRARAAVLSRRQPLFLRERSAILAKELSATKEFNFPNRRQFTFVPAKTHANRKTTLLNPAQNSSVVGSARSILQYRTAEKRKTAHTYRTERVLRKLAVRLNPTPRRAGRTGRKAFSLLTKLADKRDTYLRLLNFAPEDKKEPLRVLFIRAQRTLLRAQNRLTTIKLSRMYSPATSAGTAFRNRAFRHIATYKRYTKKCMRLQAARRLMIFDTSRPRLWHKLTHRWMKKERLMRNWLKGVKRWFRDPWLSQTVDITRPSNKRLLPGEIRSREQQVGEVVEGDENAGLTKEESLALQKAALPAIEVAKKVIKADNRRAYQLAKRAGALQKKVIYVRRAASQEALRTPRPSMWLADLQAKQKTAELAIWRTKTRKEKDEIRLAAKEAAIARAKAGLPPLAEKKAPLKMPADHWMPSIVWRDIQRRARRLEWRESDDVFARKGFRNAFRFYPSERNRAPWLESLMYNRSLFSTRLREFRRRQFPKEQKKYKWLQRVRKSLFPGRTNVYIKGRRWPRIRMYNQRLHYTLFNLPDKSAARRHFKKLNRRSRKVGFMHAQEGLSNRLDNVLIHLNMAPTIFWSRTVAPLGLLRVNGRIVTKVDHLFKAGDFIEPVWAKVFRFRNFFEPPMSRNDEPRRHKRFSIGGIPKNFHFHKGIRCFTYLGNPREGDLRRSSRLQPHLFRWFRLDSV